MNKPAPSLAPEQRRIGNRYEIQSVLGRGGMACVYRATDLVSGRDIALKELQLPESSRDRASVTSLFEREFHTLSQLAHPRVIAVHDYGLTSNGPYYTMELLDGGDLRERAPMPWREACELLFDVCSSLALLHSRRLLHRDISPRNIRCTRDGKAKLIDFGAMTSMGTGAPVVGTPAYTPPETVHRLALDGRADLFSLGVTFYTALTGQMPYPARTFAEALAAWKTKPLPPSARVATIPPALDDLVLSLISIEPALRPPSAFDVMQRLAAIADLQRDESAEVSAAYLATPNLVGREVLLGQVRERLSGALSGHGGAVLVRGGPGQGRSRMLDACVLEAKTLGASVLRASASGEQEPYTVARALVQQLLAAQSQVELAAADPELFAIDAAANTNAPPRLELKRWSGEGAEAERVQQALVRFVLTVSRTQPLMVAVDDVQRSDPASAAILAALIDKLKRGNVAVVMTAESGAEDLAVDVLARRCAVLDLPPLTREQTQMLLSSVFGDVTNLEMLTGEIHDVALGNPRQCLDMAQHLVDRQVIRYAAGTWTLPEQLSADDLPRSGADALRSKLSRLSAAARFLAGAHALAYYDLLSGDDYRALRPDADPLSTDCAVSELLTLGAIHSTGSAYTVSNRLWAAAARAELTPEAGRSVHLALAQMFRPKAKLASIYHLFEADALDEGLEAFAEQHRGYAEKGFDMKLVDRSLYKLVPAYQKAIAAAVERRSTPRQLANLRRWAVALSVMAEGAGYEVTAPQWFEQLRHDSGLDLWQADSEGGTSGDRLTRALQRAYERFLATPEAERVYGPDEAVKLLAEYVVISIAIGARTMHTTLLESLPPLLEPFVPLSPILDAIWNNAIATAESQSEGRLEAARDRWIEVLRKLDALPAGELEHVDAIANAVAYGVGLMEAQLGLPSATSFAARLEQDPLQKLSAMYLRKIVRLEQGDWTGAERLRREAEVLALSLRTLNMFNSLPVVELSVYVIAGDLTGTQQCLDQLRLMAAKYPRWETCLVGAEGYFEMVRGDFAGAIRKFEECRARAAPGPDGKSPAMLMWIAATAGLAEALLNSNRAAEAREHASAALRFCEERGINSVDNDLTRVLALAEATLGDNAPAIMRLDGLIAKQRAAGVTGPRIGQSYESRARISIWTQDEPAFEQFSRLAANEYRRGANSPLAARYERLVNEALRAGFQATAELSDFQPSTMLESNSTDMPDVQTTVLRAMTGAQRREDRAKRALRLLCEARAAAGGHLYLVGQDLPRLAASYGAVTDPENLADFVREYLMQEQSHAETMTEIATGTLLAEVEAGQATVSAGGTDYELLLLTCIVDGEGVVAGVAAVVKGERRVHYIKQTQLLNTLAAHLIQAGDAIGTRFDLG
ncbi:MAG TPA: serine/threonine-protein kinase [Polyangiales bacterium]|nr:serine/threonine-protein kinase [Polyangiales bacterium]